MTLEKAGGYMYISSSFLHGVCVIIMVVNSATNVYR